MSIVWNGGTGAVPPRNLSEALWPAARGVSYLVDVVLMVAGALLVALLAQITIPLPFTPVPITGQTFGVLLVGMTLGARRGFLSMLLYLAQGAAGLPVFAGGEAGLAKFAGPTVGYLTAFPIAAWLCGTLAERGWDRKPATAALGIFLGSLVILTLGTVVLSFYVGGLIPAILKGFLPFLAGDVVKTTLTAVALPGAWSLLGKNRRG